MLKHVPSFMDAELLWVLAAMGHGDELVVVDRNFPAQSVAMETPSGQRSRSVPRVSRKRRPS